MESRFKGQIKKLRSLLENIEKGGNAFGIEIASAERINQIDVLLEAVVGGKMDGVRL